MSEIPSVEPCSTDYCFIARPEVFAPGDAFSSEQSAEVQGDLFSTINYMLGLVIEAAQDSQPEVSDGEVEKITNTVENINRIQCIGEAVCPRWMVCKAVLDDAGAHALLQRKLAEEEISAGPLR
ncbi:MAG: hypothetical protein ABWX94_00945 [Candidatus Saccharimonadales bacterium]